MKWINRFYAGLVLRRRARVYLLLTLLSFAASVSVTRLFLQLTGYPKIGGGGLHIAHVLWGGLFLFIAGLLMLIFSNRWVFRTGAILNGVGVGLFIDEVGKFITESNDYFFPLAAPLIYAFFLLTLLLYLQVQRSKRRDVRIEIYSVLDLLPEIIDHDLDIRERTELTNRLQWAVEQSCSPDLKRLAATLLEFVSTQETHRSPDEVPWLARLQAWGQAWENRWLKRRFFRALIASSLLVFGITNLLSLLTVIRMRISIDFLEQFTIQRLTAGSFTAQELIWFMASMTLEGVTGLLLAAAAIFVMFKWERRGIWLGYTGLLIQLTISNLLVFYFDQFSTILLALVQFVLLVGLLRYRRRFLISRSLSGTVLEEV